MTPLVRVPEIVRQRAWECAWAVSDWIRDYVNAAAEAYVSGHGTREVTFALAMAEADRRAADSDVPAEVWRTVTERDLILTIQYMEAAATVAEKEIRAAVATFFDAGSSPQEVEAVAYQVNAGVLAPRRVESILESELVWFLRRSRRPRKFRR